MEEGEETPSESELDISVREPESEEDAWKL